MKRKPHPTRIGLFMIGAVALLVAAVVLVTGGGLFAQRERAIAHFEGSVYGLQLGAPVVFRGVRLGSVVGIGVVYQGQPGQYSIPVQLEIDRDRISAVNGATGAVGVADLVAQGLTAQLATQSLLTGLLYVDLDLRPAAPARKADGAPPRKAGSVGGMPEIPTVATPIQALQQQLQSLNLPQIAADLAAMASGARRLVGHPKLEPLLEDLAAASAGLRRVLARVDRQLGPLTRSLHGTLAATRSTAEQWGGAVDRVGSAIDRVGAAADRVGRASDRVSDTMGQVDGLAQSAQPALASVQRAADELAQGAAALREAATGDGGALPQIERAAQDIARASRAVRDLADLLERQPESLLRGRGSNP